MNDPGPAADSTAEPAPPPAAATPDVPTVAPDPPPDAVLRTVLGGVVALAAAMGIGRFAFTPLLPPMQAAAGFGPAEAGALASANYAGYLLGALLAATVSRRARSAVLIGGALGVAASTAAMALASSLPLWAAARFVAGLASAAVFVLASGAVLDALRRAGRGALSGWVFSGVGVGIAGSGVVVAATVGSFGWRGTWLVLGAIAALAVWPLTRWLPRPSTPTGADCGPAVAVPPPRLAFALLFAAYALEGIGYIVTGTFLVAIIEATPGLRGLGNGAWIVAGLAVIPSSAAWGALATRTGYARALALAYAAQAAGIALPLAGGAMAAFVAAALFGGTFAGITALTLTLAGRLDPAGSARRIGALTATFGVGQVAGPLAAGVLAGSGRGFAPSLVAAALLVAVAALLMAALDTVDPTRPRA